MTEAEPLPWERQRGEGAKAYHAFTYYRDLGTQRSIRRVAREVGKNPTLIGRWSRTHGWVERVTKYDAYLEKQERNAAEEERIAMVKQHATVARAMVTIAARRLLGDSQNGVNAIDVNQISARDAAKMMVEGMKMERLSRGLPSERVATEVDDGREREEERRIALLLLHDEETQDAADRLLERLANAPAPSEPSGPSSNGHKPH